MRRIRFTAGVASAAIAICALTACQPAAQAGTTPGPGTGTGTGNGTGTAATTTATADPITGPSASINTGAGSESGWSYAVTSLTNTSSPNNTLTIQYPVVAYSSATAADTVLASAENAKFKNVDESFVNLFNTEFSNPTPVTVDGTLVPSKLQVTDHANRIGRLLSVRYDAFFDRSGSASGYSEEQALTVRTDTGATLGVTDLLTPAAFTEPGRAQLAALIAPTFAGDFIFGSQTAASAVGNALATIGVLTNGMNDPVISVTPAGLEFTFQQGALTPMSNGTPSAVIPFSKLGGLINPTALALVNA